MSTNAPKLSKIQRLDIATESVFLTTAGANSYLRTAELVQRGSLTWTPIEDLHARTELYDVARITGPRNGQLTVKLQLHGYSSTLPTGAPTDTSHPFSTILAWAFGLIQSGGFVDNADTTGSTTSLIKAANLSTFKTGGALAFNTQSKGWQVAWVKKNDAAPTPDEITPLQTLPGVPYEGGGVTAVDLYGSSVVAVASGLDYYSAGVREALRLTLYGMDSDDKVIMYGCVPSGVKMSFPTSGMPTMEVTFQVAHWSEEGTGGAPSAGTWNYPQPEAVLSSWVAWGTGGASPTRVHNLEFDLGLEVAPMPDSNRTSGVGGWYVKNRRPMVTFTVYRQVNAEPTDWKDQTGKPFTFTMGTQPGKMFSLCLPNARVAEWPAPEDDNEAVISKVQLVANQHTADTTDAGSTIENTTCRFAFL